MFRKRFAPTPSDCRYGKRILLGDQLDDQDDDTEEEAEDEMSDEEEALDSDDNASLPGVPFTNAQYQLRPAGVLRQGELPYTGAYVTYPVGEFPTGGASIPYQVPGAFGEMYGPGNCFVQTSGQGPNRVFMDKVRTVSSEVSEWRRERATGRGADIPIFFFADNFPACTVDPREVYCAVPGRTSLLSSTTKYRVTVGEIQRRISAPECLNASLLGGILRKAKSKDGGKTLRDSLRRIGLTLPAGRRKQAHVTAWTALVEEEAVHIAKDFQAVCEKEFHAKELGIYLTKRNLNIERDVERRRATLQAGRKLIDELSELVSADCTPLTPFLGNNPRGVILDPNIQHHLSHFTLMTHGFGGVAVCAVLNCVRSMVDESLKYLDKAFGSYHAQPQYPVMSFRDHTS